MIQTHPSFFVRHRTLAFDQITMWRFGGIILGRKAVVCCITP